MSAIERCRTAALGGHVACCENPACGHTHVDFNSCRDRHCPKRQVATSRRWLADREAELLPVPHFHVVYTLPGKLRDISYHYKRVVYDLLMQAGPGHASISPRLPPIHSRSQMSRPRRAARCPAHAGVAADA